MYIDKRNLPYPLNLANAISANDPGRFDNENPLEFETLSEDQLKGLEFALSQLTEREQKVLEMYFKDHKTLKEIGKNFGVCAERVRQIKDTGLRKLRYPNRFDFIRYGFSAHKKMLEDRDNKYLAEYGVTGLDASIAELDISVRSFNALRRGGIKTVRELVDAYRQGGERLMHVRNFGAKSIVEVGDELAKMGLLERQ